MLAILRNSHTATLLADVTVLVAGGSDGSNSLASAELYNPATAGWTATGNLGTGRYSGTATLLSNGKVLIAGGSGNSGALPSAELYDPATSAWSAMNNLATTRNSYAANQLR